MSNEIGPKNQLISARNQWSPVADGATRRPPHEIRMANLGDVTLRQRNFYQPASEGEADARLHAKTPTWQRQSPTANAI